MFQKFLSLIKFSHTIFAMPFALLGYSVGVKLFGFDYVVLLQVVLCMVFARSAAMGFNRIVDREFDAKNPRTAVREIPSGQISATAATWFVTICSVLFVLTALSINFLCFILSPVALAVIFGYSYTKRFTSLAHIVLGIALSIAPIGAYVAVSGSVILPIWLLGVLVLCWVSGFDIIFALQDEEFDRGEKLHSIPALLGAKNALVVSSLLHVGAAGVAVLMAFMLPILTPWLYWVGTAIFLLMLLYQHLIVKPGDLSRVNLAFGTSNGVASVIYASFAILSLFI